MRAVTKVVIMVLFIVLLAFVFAVIVFSIREPPTPPKESVAYVLQTNDFNLDTHKITSRFYLKIDDAYEWQNINYTELKSILVYHHEKYGLDAVTAGDGEPLITIARFCEKVEGWYIENPGVMQLPLSELERRYYPPPTPTPYAIDYPGLYRQVVGNESQGVS